MGKSIEEILKQMESERNQRINEEQSKLDEINKQRDITRKEWNKRMRMYENLSSNSSNSAGVGSGGGVVRRFTPPSPEPGETLYYIRLFDDYHKISTLMLDGFFYVNDSTHIVQRFYDLSNPTVDIRSTGNYGGPTYLYYPGWLCFDGGGCNITTIPYAFGSTVGDYNMYGSTSYSLGLLGGFGPVTYAFSLTPF